jgi:hypothetical protein
MGRLTFLTADVDRTMDNRNDEFISASDLARLGYCERQVAFDAAYGRRSTKTQEHARQRGLKAHAAFYEESQRIADASATKGRCFVATLALGECDETRALRAFRDLYLRRSVFGRRLVGRYYKFSPRLCTWLETKPTVLRLLQPILRVLGRAASTAVRRRLG